MGGGGTFSGSDLPADGSGGEQRIVLGVDTCGPEGSVALGRLDAAGAVEMVGEIELEGRSYSSRMVAAIAELLHGAGLRIGDVNAIVTVNGPGSFTGVRVGLAAVKGLAEAVGMGIVAVSRLEVLSAKAGGASAALDAHRHEVFLRLGGAGVAARELLAGVDELNAIDLAGGQVAVCDEAAGLLLESAWPSAELVRRSAPTAGDALQLCAARVVGEFADLVLLDGHYLRRSDAEIFGEAAKAQTA